mgnify:CR=1 FL=1
MQALDFNTLSIGDIVLLRNTYRTWARVSLLGLRGVTYLVQHVDVANSVAVVTPARSRDALYLLSAAPDGGFTLEMMNAAIDTTRIEEAYQLTLEEAQEMRLDARLKAEVDLDTHLGAPYNTNTPNSVDKFIRDYYKNAHPDGAWPTTLIPNPDAARTLMSNLMDEAMRRYEEESEKENAVLDQIITESRKAYNKAVAAIQEAEIEYTYNPEAVTLVQPNADSYSARAPHTFRIGTTIMHKETPYVISRLTNTRAWVTNAEGTEVGYIANTKADGLTLNLKEIPEAAPGRYYLPASTTEAAKKLAQVTQQVEAIKDEQRDTINHILETTECNRVHDASALIHVNPYTDTLAGALAHIQSYIHAAETTKDKLEGEKEQFAWKATRLIEKSYGA